MKRMRKEASLTVEAALVLPIFLFGILFFLYFFQILFLQDTIQSGITEAGKFISRYQYLLQEEEVSVLTKQLILRQRFLEYLDEESINTSCIVGGISGISLGKSKIMEENDEIEITAYYLVQFPVPFFGEKRSLIRQNVHTRAFTGKEMKNQQEESLYDDGNEKLDEDVLVYMTENGTVYHRSEECTHLRLSITIVEKGQLPSVRNEGGGKYKPCEKCIKGEKEQTIYYIAKEGDKYHLSLSCSGLKRTIYSIPYSKVKDKRKCSRCG